MPDRLPLPLPPPADLTPRRFVRPSMLCVPLRRDDGLPRVAPSPRGTISAAAQQSTVETVRCCQLATTPVKGATIPMGMSRPTSGAPRRPSSGRIQPLPISPRLIRPLSGQLCCRESSLQRTTSARGRRGSGGEKQGHASCKATRGSFSESGKDVHDASASRRASSTRAASHGDDGDASLSDSHVTFTPGSSIPPTPSPRAGQRKGGGHAAAPVPPRQPSNAFSRLYDPKFRERRGQALRERYGARGVADEYQDRFQVDAERFFDKPAARRASRFP